MEQRGAGLARGVPPLDLAAMGLDGAGLLTSAVANSERAATEGNVLADHSRVLPLDCAAMEQLGAGLARRVRYPERAATGLHGAGLLVVVRRADMEAHGAFLRWAALAEVSECVAMK